MCPLLVIRAERGRAEQACHRQYLDTQITTLEGAHVLLIEEGRLFLKIFIYFNWEDCFNLL